MYISEDRLYFRNSKGNKLRIFDLEEGKVIEEFKMESLDRDSPMLKYGRFLFMGVADEHLQIFDLEAKKQLLTIDSDSLIKHLCLSWDRKWLFIYTDNGVLSKLKISNEEFQRIPNVSCLVKSQLSSK